jgi:hypothetical protein
VFQTVCPAVKTACPPPPAGTVCIQDPTDPVNAVMTQRAPPALVKRGEIRLPNGPIRLPPPEV